VYLHFVSHFCHSKSLGGTENSSMAHLFTSESALIGLFFVHTIQLLYIFTFCAAALFVCLFGGGGGGGGGSNSRQK